MGIFRVNKKNIGLKFLIGVYFLILSQFALADFTVTNGNQNSKLSLQIVSTSSCSGFLSTFSNHIANDAKVYAEEKSNGDIRFYFEHGTHNGNDSVKAQFGYVEQGESVNSPVDESGVKTLIDTATYTYDDSSVISENSYRVYVGLKNVSNSDQQCLLKTTGYVVVEDETPPSSDKPDLKVIDFSVSKIDLTLGENFTANAAVKNIGQSATTESSSLYYYIRTDASLILSEDYDEKDTVRALSVNSFADEDEEITAPNTPGTYWVSACATNSVPAESTTINNCAPAIKITVANSINRYAINIGLNEHGTVTANGMNCPGDCTEQYDENEVVVFTSIPFSGYEFKSWTFGSSCTNTPKQSNGNKFTITVKEDCEVRALYREELPNEVKQLSVVVDGSGFVNSAPSGINCGVDCEYFFDLDETITLYANPSSGWEFDSWAGMNLCSDLNSCSVAMDSSYSVTAIFKESTLQPTTEPKLNSFTPTSVQKGVETLIAFNGENLPSTFVANIYGMPTSCVNQSVTQQQIKATCVGNEVSEGLRFSVKDRPAVDGGKIIEGSGNWTIAVTPPPNTSPSVWIDVLPISVVVNNQFSVTVKTDDLNNDLVSVQADWGADGSLDRLVNVSDSSGQDVVFSYTPTTVGTLYIKFIATDANGAKGQIIYTVPVIPASTEGTGVGAKEQVRETNTECQGNTVNGSNPIDPASGAKIETKQLLMVNGLVPIDFTINYNSLILEESPVGKGWDFENSHAAMIREESNGDMTVLWSDNSHHIYTKKLDGTFFPFSFGCQLDHLEKLTNGGYKVTRRSRTAYIFNEFNFLERIENEKGQGVDLTFNEKGQIVQAKEAVSGASITYHYSDKDMLEKAVTSSGIQALFQHDGLGRLIEITHADGVKESFTYNELGQILLHKLNGLILSSTSYDGFGRAIEQEDARTDNQNIKISYAETGTNITTTILDKLGNTSTKVFDKHYLLLSETDQENNQLSYTYNDDGKPTEIVDGRGNTTQFTYNEFGDVLETVFADSSKITNKYDNRRNLIQRTDQLNQVELFTYNLNNNLVQYTDENLGVTTYTYNADNQLVSEKTPENRITRYEYTNGRLTKATDPLNNISSKTYDLDGRLISNSDFAGNVTTFRYDGKGRKIESIDALGFKQTWRYDSRGNAIVYQDQNRHDRNHSDAVSSSSKETRYEYDGEGNHIRTIKTYNTLDTVIEALAYDGNNRLISQTDANNYTTQYVRDKAGRVVKTIDPFGNEYTSVYDDNNNVTRSTSPLGGSIDYVHDNLNRTTKTTDSLNRTFNTTYDALGRIVQTKDPLNRLTDFKYSKLSELTNVISPGSLVSKEAFDKDQLLKTATGSNNNIRTLERDANGRIIKETAQDGVVILYSYNSRGLVTSMTNGRGEVTSYTYDELSRLITKVDDVSTINYVYAPNGSLLEVIEGTKKIARKYRDEADRVTEYKPDDSSPRRIVFNYDDFGNLEALGYPCSNSKCYYPINYVYNERNLIQSVSDFSNGFTAQYEYDEKLRLVKTIRGNGTVETRTYDSENQLKQVKDVTSNGNNIIQFDYEYDDLGRLIKENMIPDSIPPKALLQSMASQYTYTDNNRLQEQDGKSFDFDGDGNILEAEGLGLEFNARRQLTKASDTTYQYDAEGHRINMTHIGSETTYLVNPHANLSQILMINSDRLIYGQGLIAQRKTSGEYYYFHYDYRGSVVAVSNGNGTVVERYGYLPYGKRYSVPITPTTTPTISDTPPPNPGDDSDDDTHIESVSPGDEVVVDDIFTTSGEETAINQPFGYNAREGVLTDPNGLYYMRARYYSSEQRRFISKDALRGQIGDLASLNRYGYVGGDPVNAVDPSGKEVYLQWHTVFVTNDHSLIKIVPEKDEYFPEDWQHWAEDGNGNALLYNGKKFFTIGAGPEDGNLVNGYNRKNDVSKVKNGSRLIDWKLLGYECEQELISKLIGAHDSYKNRLKYSYGKPIIGQYTDGDLYNSNSYTNSILQRSGVYTGQPTSRVVGWGNLLPNSAFK